jgi:hypothetical protein
VLGLSASGALSGTSAPVTLPADANNTPLGAAFGGDILGFTPAHSPDSFALVNKTGDGLPVLAPQPAYPTNAPCWLAKGPGNIWYAGNSPGQAISIFFSDGQGGTFYKSVPVGGVPTDVSVSPDGKWLAAIFTASDGSGGRIPVFANRFLRRSDPCGRVRPCRHCFVQGRRIQPVIPCIWMSILLCNLRERGWRPGFYWFAPACAGCAADA